MGKSLIYVPECHSTNLFTAELAQNRDYPEGTIVITDRQTSGKGQRGNTWLAEPGANFTFSLLLKPAFLRVAEQFQLTLCVSLGICDYLSLHLTSGVCIKWPNDILVNGRKICGILIENQLQGHRLAASIVGIGLNMNQAHFDLPAATSLTLETGCHYPLAEELERLAGAVEARYLHLKEGRSVPLLNDYLSRLYGKGEKRLFRIDGIKQAGVIEGVDSQGLLVVSMEGGLRRFANKQIEFLE